MSSLTQVVQPGETPVFLATGSRRIRPRGAEGCHTNTFSNNSGTITTRYVHPHRACARPFHSRMQVLLSEATQGSSRRGRSTRVSARSSSGHAARGGGFIGGSIMTNYRPTSWKHAKFGAFISASVPRTGVFLKAPRVVGCRRLVNPKKTMILSKQIEVSVVSVSTDRIDSRNAC